MEINKSVPFSRLAVAVIVALGLATVGLVPAQRKPHYPEVNEEVFLRFSFKLRDVVKVIDVPVELLSPLIPCDPDQVVKLPGGYPEVHVKNFLPRAVLRQQVVPDPSGQNPPVITLQLRGPKIRVERRLMANDPTRSKMLSIIASWQYLHEADPKKRRVLFEQFESELSREPALLVTPVGGGPKMRLAAKVGEEHRLERFDARVRIKAFYPHFSSDPKTGKPFNVSLKRRNPAAQLEVERAGKKRTIWVFSRYPDFSRDASGANAFRIRLDCPLELPRATPDFILMSLGGDATELWTRHRGKTTARPLEKGERVTVPGSRYTFHVSELVPSGRLEEDYELTKAERAQTVLRLETREPGGGGEAMWLVLNRERTINTAKGALHVTMRSREKRAPRIPSPRGGKK